MYVYMYIRKMFSSCVSHINVLVYIVYGCIVYNIYMCVYNIFIYMKKLNIHTFNL